MYLYTVYVYGQLYSLQYYWDARYIYMYTDVLAVQLKLTQQCKSTILQEKLFKEAPTNAKKKKNCRQQEFFKMCFNT